MSSDQEKYHLLAQSHKELLAKCEALEKQNQTLRQQLHSASPYSIDLEHLAGPNLAIEKLSALLDGLIQNIPDLIFFKNLEGRYLGCNDAFLEFSGKTREEFIGKHDQELYPPALVEFFLESDRKAAQQNTPFQYTEWVEHPEKGTVLLETYKTVYFSEEGSPLGIIGICRDITHRTRAEESALHNEKRYLSLFKDSPVGILISGHDSSFKEVNNAFCDLLGFTKEELIGKTMDMITLNEDMEGSVARSQSLRSGITGTFAFRKRYLKKDGSIVSCIVTASRFGSKNEPVRETVVMVLDMTEAELAEKKLQEQNAELKKINRELDRFVYSAAHDLRAPLMSVLGLIGLIKKEKDDASRNIYLELQEKSLRKLDEYIQEIVYYSQNNRQEISSEPISFENLLQEVLDQYQHLPQSATIETRIEIDQPKAFFSDPSRLLIILHNLISNAFRYCDPKKKSQSVAIHIKVENDVAVIKIEDNGLGIPKTHLGSIFDMFYRAHPRTSGSGLGLYVTQEAIKKLQGTVEAKSILGEGSTFTVKIPFLRQ